MASKRYFLFFPALVILAVFLSACGGAAFVPSGWPGLTVSQDMIFLANNQFVYAVRVADGTQAWRYPAQADRNKSFFATPVVTDDGQVIVGGYDNKIYSLNVKDGTEKWSFPAKDRFIASPLVVNGTIFAPNADGTLYALDLKGSLVWSFREGSSLWAQPTTAPDCSCIYLGSIDHKLYSLDVKTGKPLWGPVDMGSAILGTPVLSKDGSLYLGTFGKEIAVVNAKSGKILWRIPTDGMVWAGPALDGDRLYFGDILGNFYILSIPDKKILKKVQPDGPITNTPLVTQDGVYFTAESGTIYKIDRDGNQLWNHSVEGKNVDGLLVGGVINTSPVLAGNLILVAPMQTETVLVSLSPTGSQNWAFVPPK